MVQTLNSGPSIGVDTRDLKKFAAALRKGAPLTYRGLRASMREAGKIVADEAKARIEGASTTIPPTIKVRTIGGVGVAVQAGSPNVPIAGLFEEGNKGGGGGTFRHPVFGNTDVWVKQPMHPYLLPAFRDKSEEVVEKIAEVIDDVLRVIAYDDEE